MSRRPPAGHCCFSLDIAAKPESVPISPQFFLTISSKRILCDPLAEFTTFPSAGSGLDSQRASSFNRHKLFLPPKEVEMYTTIRIRLASSQTAIAVVAILGLVCTTHAQNIIMFDAPNSGGTIATAINSTGQITGYYQDTTSGITHGFLRETDGTIITFDGPPLTLAYSDFTVGLAINSAGQIAGSYVEYSVPAGEFLEHGFLRDSDGTITTFDIGHRVLNSAINPAAQIAGSYVFSDLPSPTAAFLRYSDGSITTFYDHSGFTVFTAINAKGQITGDGGAIGSFLRQPDGTVTTFAVPNASLTYPIGINSSTQITGYFQDTNLVNHGFLRRRDGTLARFRVPNASATVPVAINSLGQITGYYLDATYAYHGFLRQTNGTISTLDVPNATLTHPTGINSSGQITGYYQDSQFVLHGFVRTSEK